MHQTKDFIDPQQAIEFIQSIRTGNVIDVVTKADGTFCVNWVAIKKYVADGVEYDDEVWTTQDGRMINCQDLEQEHAKNIIRMTLRNERKYREQDQALAEALQTAVKALSTTDDLTEDDLPEWTDDTPQRVFH